MNQALFSLKDKRKENKSVVCCSFAPFNMFQGLKLPVG